MKKSIFYLFLLLASAVYSQDAKYVQAMEKNISILDSATVPASFQNANNAFERIGNANPKEWLPLYYQAYCHTMIGMRQEENSKKDEHYDKAEILLISADSLSPQNSEIFAMKAFLTGMKISVDPMTRGQQLGMKSSMYNSQAVQYDKENPRAYLIRGTALMYMPAQYGGGKDNALPVLEQSVEKFKNFKPVSTIMPHWGEARAMQMLEQCKNMK